MSSVEFENESMDIDMECLNNKHDISFLNNIRDKIDGMSKFNQIEILRILKIHNSVIINENKYGIHINLSELNKNIIDELNVYINYVNKQELELSQAEQQKENYKNIYFIKDGKDNKDNLSNKNSYNN